MILYYDKQAQKFSMKKTESNEAVFETSNIIGWTNGHDQFSCDIFRFQIHTNFYPQAPHQEYILIDIFINDILLLPISLAYDNGKFNKDRISLLQYGIDHYRLYPNRIRSPHTIVLYNHKKDWLPDYDDAWTDAFYEVCSICNNKDWMFEQTQKLLEKLGEHRLEKKPHYLRILLELTNNWYKACPKVVKVLQPILDKFCYERMSLLINKVQNHNDPLNANINISELVKSGDFYWNHIKSHALPEPEVQDSQE